MLLITRHVLQSYLINNWFSITLKNLHLNMARQLIGLKRLLAVSGKCWFSRKKTRILKMRMKTSQMKSNYCNTSITAFKNHKDIFQFNNITDFILDEIGSEYRYFRSCIMPNMNTSKVQIARSYLASLTGGWVPYGDEATLNQIIQLYLWVLFASIPIIIQLILQSQWISSCLSFGFIFIIVLLIKLICYNLHKVFDTNEANQLTVPEMVPAWFALRKVLEIKFLRVEFS